MTLEERAQVVAGECQTVGVALAEYGETIKTRVTFLRIINVVVSMAVFITLIPAFSGNIGPFGVSAVSLAAGIVLLLDTVLPLFVGRDSPERYEDYAKYIMGYKDSLEETLIDTSLDEAIKRVRISETIALAQANLRDVKAKMAETGSECPQVRSKNISDLNRTDNSVQNRRCEKDPF
jgi:hypothetical protein